MLKELTKIVVTAFAVLIWAVLTLAIGAGCSKAPTGPSPDYYGIALQNAVENGITNFGYWNGTDEYLRGNVNTIAGPPTIEGPLMLAPRQRPSGWLCDPTTIDCWYWHDGTEYQTRCDFGDCVPLGHPF